jgi:hypothetical protein
MIEISKIGTTIDTLKVATNDELKLIFKHIDDIVILTRIISLASQHMIGDL